MISSTILGPWEWLNSQKYQIQSALVGKLCKQQHLFFFVIYIFFKKILEFICSYFSICFYYSAAKNISLVWLKSKIESYHQLCSFYRLVVNKKLLNKPILHESFACNQTTWEKNEEAYWTHLPFLPVSPYQFSDTGKEKSERSHMFNTEKQAVWYHNMYYIFYFLLFCKSLRDSMRCEAYKFNK